MQTTHLFLGSIGVLAETSDIQRRAYNAALSEAGVPWGVTDTELSDATIVEIHP